LTGWKGADMYAEAEAGMTADASEWNCFPGAKNWLKG
jgi:hypothetical protein